MKVKDMKCFQFHFQNKEEVEFVNCGSPPLKKQDAEPIVQEVYNTLTGRGLTYIQCFLIIDIVMGELRNKRDAEPL